MNETVEAQLKIFADAERTLGGNHPDLVPVLDELAYCYHSRGIYDKAEECYQRSISITEHGTGATDARLVPRLHNLAVLYRIQNKFPEAEAIYKRTLDTMSQTGAKKFDLATQQNYLAGLYFAWGRYADAERLINQSMTLYESEVGRDHEYVAFCLMALALTLQKQGKLDEANERFRQCERLSLKAPRFEYLESFRDLAHGLFFLARTKFKQNQFDEAEILFRYALLEETWELWPFHPLVAQNLQMIGDLYAAQGMFAEAEKILSKTLSLRRQVLGEEHSEVAVTAHALAKLWQKMRRYKEAEQMYELAISIRKKSAYPPLLATTMQGFSQLLRELDRKEEAAQYEAKALQILDTYRPPHLTNS
ncbi:MAG TPA: tetratricopeptide repeat protein [Candidatus Obscuribacterales bacterium]